MHQSLAEFHPAIAAWFAHAFAAPSPAQVLAWPAIRRGENTLLLAPTGSGKTLAAFLCAIDRLLRQDNASEFSDVVHTLYITPLKALGNDIQRNLLQPLAEIRAMSAIPLPEVRVGVRTGDTPPAERQRMVHTPPHILITTPESLYLLLQSRKMWPALRGIRTVIIDEVHALCAGKRGTHLSVSLERLEALAARPLQRIGCSATISPLDEIAGFLVGVDAARRQRPCSILDAGMRKSLDVQVMAPLPDFLVAGQTALWASAYELLLREISAHTTTLVFCNSRYKAERTALHLTELAEGRARIGVHHGSMARDARLGMEDALKAGTLDALVATSSLELGIDIGSVDLVYQLESPKSIAAGLQRIGRAGHLLHRTSKGRMVIFERDELLEAAVIGKHMRDGVLDDIAIPHDCLDVLAQQIAGAVAAGDWDVETLFQLVRRAYPYRQLPRERFDAVLGMLSGEYPFQMPHPPLPFLLWDRAGGRLSATRGAAMRCAQCVGTISENAEYEVVIERKNRRIGKIHAEFVDDSLRTGDVFVLGSSSWKVTGKRRDQVLVEEAPGSTPTVPWWMGPIEPRTIEVGGGVGLLRRQVADRLSDPGVADWLMREYPVSPAAAAVIIDYVHEQHLAAGLVPDQRCFLVESWRDDLGHWNLMVHCPLGQRVNRTWGTALATAARRHGQRWSVTVSNDVLLLTLLSDATAPLAADTWLGAVTADTLAEHLLRELDDLALAGAPFRDTATCALQILRAHNGKRVPYWLQSFRAQELYDAARACEEYPVVAEVRRAYLDDTLDIHATAQVLARIAAGEIALEYRTVESPSPFAHSLLMHHVSRGDHQMGRDRRAHLLRLHRKVLQEVLNEEEIAQLLDPRAIERLEHDLRHVTPSRRAQSSDELAQIIREVGDLPAQAFAITAIANGDAMAMLAPLLNEHRVVGIEIPDCDEDPFRLVTAERWREYHDAFRHEQSRLHVATAAIADDGTLTLTATDVAGVIPARWRNPQPRDAARRAVVARYLQCHGPVTLYDLMRYSGWPAGVVQAHLDALVAAGVAVQGVYAADKPRPQWVNRVNLEEIHRLTLTYLKRELAACAPAEVMDFITRWQHRHPETRLTGLEGLRAVIRQLQGVEMLTAALEGEMLAERLVEYAPAMLDHLIATGEVCWRRVGARLTRGKVALCLRKDAEWLAGGPAVLFDVEAAADVDISRQILAVRDYFRRERTTFFDEMVAVLGLDEGAATRAVWYLAWAGEVTCDTYACLRHSHFTASLSACYDLDSTPWKIVHGQVSADRVLKQMRRRKLDPRLGRWSATERVAPPAQQLGRPEIVRNWARLLLERWGIVTRDMLQAEDAAPPWPELAPEFKRLELLGSVQRGYFIDGHAGEQYGLPEAIEMLRDCRARRGEEQAGLLRGEPVWLLSNRDPANLYASCLDCHDDRGTVFTHGGRAQNSLFRFIVQAGQTLLVNATQLVTLPRAMLGQCIAMLTADADRHGGTLAYNCWNNMPIDLSPVAPLLWDAGFRRNSRKEMVYPGKGNSERPSDAGQASFPAYYADTAPVAFGPAMLVAGAADSLQPTVEKVLDVVATELERRGWTVTWSAKTMSAAYREIGRLGIYIARSFVDISVSTRTVRAGIERLRMLPWSRCNQLRAVSPDEVNAEFLAAFQRLLAQAEEISARYHAARDNRRQEKPGPGVE